MTRFLGLAVILAVGRAQAVQDERNAIGPMAQALGEHLKPKDLRRSSESLNERVTAIGKKLAFPFHEGANLPSRGVKGQPAWRIVYVRPDDWEGYHCILLLPGPHGRVRALPLMEKDFGGEDALDAEWSIRDGLLVGVGHSAMPTSGPPGGGLVVFRVTASGARELQSEGTNAELSQRSVIEWDPLRPSTVVAWTRENEFRSGFGVPHAGPQRNRKMRWQFRNGRFKLIGRHWENNPLNAFDGIAAAVENEDFSALRRLIPEHGLRRRAMRSLRWAESHHQNHPRIVCGTCEADATVFTLISPENEALKRLTFYFAQVGGRWRLSRVSDGARIHPLSKDPVARLLEIGLSPNELGEEWEELSWRIEHCGDDIQVSVDLPFSSSIQRVQGRKDMLVVRLVDQESQEENKAMWYQTFGRNYLIFLDHGELCARRLTNVALDEDRDHGCLLASRWRIAGHRLIGIGETDNDPQNWFQGAIQVFDLARTNKPIQQTRMFDYRAAVEFVSRDSMDVRVRGGQGDDSGFHISQSSPFLTVRYLLRWKDGRYVTASRSVDHDTLWTFDKLAQAIRHGNRKWIRRIVPNARLRARLVPLIRSLMREDAGLDGLENKVIDLGAGGVDIRFRGKMGHMTVAGYKLDR